MAQMAPPGSFFSYCNAGYILLGRLIEQMRGLSWDAALRKHLLEPLGAADTATLPEEAIMRRCAVGNIMAKSRAVVMRPRRRLERDLGNTKQ